MWSYIGLLALVTSIVYMLVLKRQSAKEEDGLNVKELPIIVLTEIFSPILAGAVYYYGWRHQFPRKAHQANQISLAILIILVAGYILYQQPI